MANLSHDRENCFYVTQRLHNISITYKNIGFNHLKYQICSAALLGIQIYSDGGENRSGNFQNKKMFSFGLRLKKSKSYQYRV